ncbi:MAG: 16S rRNA (guanine(527)-N(7))-methyltransferase RsmG [Bacteroidota bacterium]
MSSSSFEIVKKYFPDLTGAQLLQFEKLQSVYADWNEKINVISRKDFEHFYERHVLHSLSIAKLISFTPASEILDFGTGGGFPGIPLAIFFPEVNFHLVDSIGKKIQVVNEVIKELNIENVFAEKARVEELKTEYDFITCRGVAEIPRLLNWTNHLLKKENNNTLKNGWLLLKGGDLKEEVKFIPAFYQFISISDYFEEEYFKEKKIVYLRK